VIAARAASPDTRYRVVCYELSGEEERVVMDATGDGFIAAAGVISAGRLRGELLSAGTEELQAHLALQIASDEQLAGFIAPR
jgi:hypothetical protein